MEKTLTIDGRKVTFKSTGALPVRYKSQFGEDFFKDVMTALNVSELFGKELTIEEIKSVDFDVFYRILWTMAKTADKDIPEPLDWLDEFDEFPLIEILPEVIDLLMANLYSTKKK